MFQVVSDTYPAHNLMANVGEVGIQYRFPFARLKIVELHKRHIKELVDFCQIHQQAGIMVVRPIVCKQREN